MSLKQITVTVQTFISHTRNELLVIKGKWGAGKTFFWRNLIQTSMTQKCVGKDYYSYVSLFGINSLEELNNAIPVSRVDANPTNTQATLDALTSNLRKLMGGLEKVPAIREYTGGMIGAALHLLLENTLVCFDDIERRGAGLTVTDIFGLASLLKEQRGCKVVLIMNEEGLDEEGQRQFKLHGEKTIDSEIRFFVTEQEAHSYVFPPDYPYAEVIRNSCSILHIENIRTLQRIKRYIEDVRPYLTDLEEELAKEIIRSLTLFVWSYHAQESGAPPLHFILGYSPVDLYLAKQRKKELSADEKRWSEVMSSYNYSHTDDAERCLAQFVDTGFVDEPRLKQELSKANELFRAQKSRDSLTEEYEIFHNSFDNNEEEFLKILVDNFRSNISVMSVSNLDGVVSTLRGFEQESVAQSLIDEYFNQGQKLEWTRGRAHGAGGNISVELCRP